MTCFNVPVQFAEAGKRETILVNMHSNYQIGKGLACNLLCMRTSENRLNQKQKLPSYNVRTLLE